MPHKPKPGKTGRGSHKRSRGAKPKAGEMKVVSEKLGPEKTSSFLDDEDLERAEDADIDEPDEDVTPGT